jgi:hypothetical protein
MGAKEALMLQKRLIGILVALLLALCAPRATAQTCASGVTLGTITLPPPGAVGSIEGQLILGHTGPTVYKLMGALKATHSTPAGAHAGVIEGVLFDANAPSHLVRGRWFADAQGQGYFRCIVFELGPAGARVGRIGGKFPPPPGPLASSPFQGMWLVCK